MSSRRARRSSSASAPSTCAPASRSSTRPPTACSRSPRTRTSSRSREQYRICEIAFDLVGRGMGVGRVIARPFVGAPGAFTRTANRHDYALDPTGETLLDVLTRDGIAGGVDRQDPRPLRRPRHRAGVPHVERRRRHGPARGGDARYAGRPDLRQPRRLRHAVRPSQRRGRLRREPRALRRAPRRACSPALRETDLLVVTRRSRQRSEHAEHRPLARVRAGAADRRRACAPAPTSARGAPSPISARRWPATSASARWPHGTSFLEDDSLSSIREALEQRERETLAPQAAKSADSRGRLRPEPEDDVRPAFQHDRDRIIHSKAFRRLKHKTQVFFAPAGDHYRTRLTHTLEVSQIARTIAKVLRLHEELTESIALGHDLGHTPFGHAGERVLDQLDARRLPPLRAEPAHRRRARERRPRPQPDLGSARRHRPPLEREEGLAGRRSTRRSASATLEGQIMRVADLIAYVNHDIDDAVRAGMLKAADLPHAPGRRARRRPRRPASRAWSRTSSPKRRTAASPRSG